MSIAKTAADIIADRLFRAGCRHAFGIPGGEVLTVMNSLKNAGLLFYLVKHENSGGFMAEGVHHANGAPGVLLATVGPGVVNAVNTVANAWQDQVPLIFLSGCVDAVDTQQFTHQVFDHTKVLEPITKASFRVAEGAVGIAIDKAITIATTGRPGPVHLDIPISVANSKSEPFTSPNSAMPAQAAPAPSTKLNAARQALSSAKRPLIIAGVDTLHHNAAAVVCDTAHRFKIPVLTTYKAKGILPEDDHLALGGHGLSPKSFDIIKPLIDASDVILLVGYDPIEMRNDWINPWPSDSVGKTVIDFSAEINTHYVHQSTYSFVGHVGAGLKRLTQGISASANIWPDGLPEKIKKTLAQAFPTDEAWGPAAVIDSVRDTLPRNGVVCVDTGAHRILISQQWKSYEPRQILQSTGLCTMGVALPLAMGYKLVKPEIPVVALTGDGGLEMILGELATARDLELAIPIIVFVDQQLALIEIKQRRDQLQNLGVDFGGTDFVAVAQAMGGYGILAETRKMLTSALLKAISADKFTVIACPIGSQAYNGRF
ncbi:MAG: acetolactate synthase [Rhodospirillaceae bacterium TMED8]|nr:acetolactate synthase [Magnetovibrio sp.]OUT53207.1 MAG: acetolactate synthase [Rhodospirillaceae bacterium TMED8]|tara:strand:- start:1115 stop:2743 length:1629 start_codon:yes stop_codon:yes gene_type:complete